MQSFHVFVAQLRDVQHDRCDTSYRLLSPLHNAVSPQVLSLHLGLSMLFRASIIVWSGKMTTIHRGVCRRQTLRQEATISWAPLPPFHNMLYLACCNVSFIKLSGLLLSTAPKPRIVHNPYGNQSAFEVHLPNDALVQGCPSTRDDVCG